MQPEEPENKKKRRGMKKLRSNPHRKPARKVSKKKSGYYGGRGGKDGKEVGK